MSESVFLMFWIANVLLLMGCALGTLFVSAHSDPALCASEREKRTVGMLAVIYFSAAIFAAGLDLAVG